MVKCSHLMYIHNITLQCRTQDSIGKIYYQQHLGWSDEEMAPFYKNPLTKLKRLEIKGLVSRSESIKDIFDFFPCLETLIYQQSGIFGLPIQNLISVLNSFGDVKNLSLSNLNIILTGLDYSK